VTLFRRYRSSRAVACCSSLLAALAILARSSLVRLPKPRMQPVILLNFLWICDDVLSWQRNHQSPGPWLAGVSSIPLIYYVQKGDFYEWLEGLHKRYGDRVRVYAQSHVVSPDLTYGDLGIGPNRLSTSDAGLIQRMDEKFTRSPRYGAAIDPNSSHKRNVTSSTDQIEHERLRKTVVFGL
jgi:hypothetical protein